MSQAGIISVEGSDPQVPTEFETDSGTAIPLDHVLEILGNNGITTSGSGNTVTISLTGGGAAIDEINVDAATAPGTDPVLPNASGSIAVTGAQVASSGVGANVIRTNSLSANSYTIEVQQAGSAASSNTTLNGVAHFKSSQFSVSNGFVSASDTGLGRTITGDTGGALSPTAGNWNIQGGAALSAGTNAAVTSGSGSTLTLTAINTAKWIVDPTANRGTHQTIGAALTAASSGETIFIRPGTYTENLTLKVGVNLTAFTCDAFTPNVTIIGTCTLTTAGTVSISGVRLQTNSAALLAVTGSAASIVNLNNCFLNCSNATGITFSTNSASAAINIYNCQGNLGTTGIGLFAHSSAGSLLIAQSDFTNTGLSQQANTASLGILAIRKSLITNPITTSSTNAFVGETSTFSTVAQNVTAITMGGSGNQEIDICGVDSGSASAISISSTGTVFDCIIKSTNTNCITGAGAINYSGLLFSSSSTINTTTKTIAGTLQGSKNTAPTSGFIGEQIRSYIAIGSTVPLTNNTAANITSISLTPGIWDVSGVWQFVAAATTSATVYSYSISPTSATLDALGDDSLTLSLTSAIVGYTPAFTIPSFRVTLSATTTYYLVAASSFSVSTMSCFGRLSATRVG